MDCKKCGNLMSSFLIANLEGRNPWVCQECHQDQRYPVDPRNLMEMPDDRDHWGPVSEQEQRELDGDDRENERD
jgi:hypothetical protein